MWHADLIRPGMRVLDLACGDGRHAVAAARRGASVTALDADVERLSRGRAAADLAGVTVDWRETDLRGAALPTRTYDLVMLFNYLDRDRIARFLEAVAPGGYFLGETFLEQQRAQGWGPTSDAHLVKPGELWSLTSALEIVLAREVLEALDGRSRAVASVLAFRRPE